MLLCPTAHSARSCLWLETSRGGSPDARDRDRSHGSVCGLLCLGSQEALKTLRVTWTGRSACGSVAISVHFGEHPAMKKVMEGLRTPTPLRKEALEPWASSEIPACSSCIHVYLTCCSLSERTHQPALLQVHTLIRQTQPQVSCIFEASARIRESIPREPVGYVQF